MSSDQPTNVYSQEVLSQLSAEVQRNPILTVLAGNMAGRQLTVSAAETVIGRGGDCDLVLTDDGVSRRHARLQLTEEGVFLEDLGSTNGCFVGGQRVQRVLLRDDDKIVLGPDAILVFHLVDTVEESVQAAMFQNATRDALTGLYNKRLFQEFLHAEWNHSRRHGQPLSLLLIDLDKFKAINDTYGHPAGDAILQGFARTLERTVRTEDVAARVGGEEFAVILRRCSLEAGLALAERMREAVEHSLYRIPTTSGERDHKVTVSVGAACDLAPDELVAAADQALYQSKANGRNRVTAAG